MALAMRGTMCCAAAYAKYFVVQNVVMFVTFQNRSEGFSFGSSNGVLHEFGVSTGFGMRVCCNTAVMQCRELVLLLQVVPCHVCTAPAQLLSLYNLLLVDDAAANEIAAVLKVLATVLRVFC
jgi:hypothetical protein